MTTGTLYTLGNVGTDERGEPIIGAIVTMPASDLRKLANLIGEKVTIVAEQAGRDGE